MKFNILSLIGLILLAAAVAFLLGVGLPGQETLFEVGEFQATVETERSVPPVVSGILGALGIAAIAVGQMAGRR